MWDILYYLAVVIAIAVAAIIGIFLLRAVMNGIAPLDAMGGLFGPKSEKRLDVVEFANVDGRRRLMLIRRDDVEHLIMTGGPVDVVLETGIQQPVRAIPSPGSTPASPSTSAPAAAIPQPIAKPAPATVSTASTARPSR